MRYGGFPSYVRITAANRDRWVVMKAVRKPGKTAGRYQVLQHQKKADERWPLKR
jgi:hypothetical protein